MSGAAPLKRAQSSKAIRAAKAVSAPGIPIHIPTPAEIRAARERAGLTQAQAAVLAGYGAQSRWAELEAGRRMIDAWRWQYFLHRAGLDAMPFAARDK